MLLQQQDKQKNEMIGASRCALPGNFEWKGKAHFPISRSSGEEEWHFFPPKDHVKTVEKGVADSAKQLINKMLK